MTASRIRVAVADDHARFVATDLTVWFAEVPSASTEELLLGLPADQRFAADVEGLAVGSEHDAAEFAVAEDLGELRGAE